MKLLRTVAAAAALLLSSNAMASWIGGLVYCDVNMNGEYDEGIDIPLSGIQLVIETADGSYTTGAVTDANGVYFSDVGTELGGWENALGDWVVSVDGASLNPGASVSVPADGTLEVTLTRESNKRTDLDIAIDDPACRDEGGLCWMTGGGVKFETVTQTEMAERGPRDTLGGNVYPSCSEFPGNGGQWNHVSHSNKLHFMGTDIVVTRCGNVPGIEPGSESPVTPYNFIEFEGTGWVQGIKGNKVTRTPVVFNARVEDRNEPGNERASAGEDIDRYYLNVPGWFTIADENGDPITITGGNLQLHATSCDN